MKMSFFSIIAFSILIFGSFFISDSFAERDCDSDTVCVQPGDFLRYEIKSGEALLEFNDELQNDKINFKWTDYDQDGVLVSERFYVLDKNSGKYTIDINNQKMEVPLMHFLSKEIIDGYEDNLNCKKLNFDFNGITRNVIECMHDENDVRVDVETRLFMLLEIKFGDLNSITKLIDTNIFDSNPLDDFVSDLLPKPTPKPIVQSKIPDWIKNNAGWWADGAINDESFTQGIQYLIKEKIIDVVVPTAQKSSSNQKVPDWIKNNAGWWADGMISEDDFLKGIQYLVESGIINVNESTRDYSVFPAYHNAVIQINAAQVNFGNIVTLSIIDPDLNKNPTSTESFSLDELSILVNDKITINPSNLSPFYTKFIETGFNTGIFQNQFTLKSSEIKLQSGDVIEFGYNDKTLNENEFPIDEELGGYISTSITVLDPVQPQNTQSSTQLLSEEEVVSKILDFKFAFDYDSLIGRTVQQEGGENIISYGVYYEPDDEIVATLVLFENDDGIHTISSGLEYELDQKKANHAVWILSVLHHKIIPVEKWKEETDTVFLQWVMKSVLSLEETNQITVDGKTVKIIHEKPTSSFSTGHITILIEY